MGLFDAVVGQLTGGSGQMGGAPASLVGAVLEYGRMMPGGIQGLLGRFESAGLGHIVQSWIGKGPNQPINEDQVQQVVGDEGLQQLSSKSGLPVPEVRSHLTGLLPTLVDKLTPDGKVPSGEGGAMGGGLGGMLGGLFGGK